MAEIFAPDRFRATMGNNLGVQSPNRFQVKFPNISGLSKPGGGSVRDKTNGEDRALFCTAAGMPGKQIQSTVRAYGIENQMVANGHTMPEVTFTFYLANTMAMREYFERWMQAITDQEHDKKQFVGYYDEYSKYDVEVAAYTKVGLRGYTVKLINCFPTAINEVQFNNQLSTAPNEMSVSIAYRTYKTTQELSSPF
jgi:hypothetical protein